jgi:hypothetical protein
MNVIFVDPEFAQLVDGYCEQHYPHLRLGARIVDNGIHAGKGLVTVDIITCTPEWAAMFSGFVVGSPTFQPGSTVTLRDIYGKQWTYTIYDIAQPSTLFNAPAL